jgi:GYF domain 2
MEDPKEPQYFIRTGTETKGPYSVDALETLALRGDIVPTTLLGVEGSGDFKPVNESPVFKKLFPSKTWTLAKERPAFVAVNAAPKAGVELPKGNAVADSGKATKGRPISSREEWEARTAADPYDPILVSTMNEATYRMTNDGVTQEQALESIFAANKELNRTRNTTGAAQFGREIARTRSSATKFAVFLGGVCAVLMYNYPAARTNGEITVALIGLIYGISMFAAKWIVRMHQGVFCAMTAVELYVGGWSIWVIISIFRHERITDPFQALFDCLTRWHL